jgi:hypothetical protein
MMTAIASSIKARVACGNEDGCGGAMVRAGLTCPSCARILPEAWSIPICTTLRFSHQARWDQGVIHGGRFDHDDDIE